MDASGLSAADRVPLPPPPPSARELGTPALIAALYEELRWLAYRRMARERRELTLQPTALVHEAFLRLAAEPRSTWASRAQFFRAAATAMRRILVEGARRRQRVGSADLERRVSLEEVERAVAAPAGDGQLLALDEALTRLGELDARLHDVVLLRHYAGLTLEETAALLGVSARTARRDWATARLWLYRRVSGRASGAPAHGIEPPEEPRGAG